MNLNQADQKYIQRCFHLAQKGIGHASPNPLVGCVIVKNKKIIAEGFHKKFGGHHAEIEALKKIKFKADGATLYCNLEPCFHYGKTPPCVHQIIKSGIKRVVIANIDPHPKVSGQSIRLLKSKGIKIKVGVLKNEGYELNRKFFTWIQKNRPYIHLKVAMSLDGAITPPHKKTGWITGHKIRKHVHQIRSEHDAILVGINTLINDNSKLNVRGIKNAKQPARIILDSHLKTPLDSKIFKTKGEPIFIATLKTDLKLQKKFEKKGATILKLPSNSKKQVALKPLLKKLSKLSISSLLVEGGAQVYQSFLALNVVDEFTLMLAPKYLGETSKKLINFNKLDSTLKKSFHLISANVFGPDLEFRFRGR